MVKMKLTSGPDPVSSCAETARTRAAHSAMQAWFREPPGSLLAGVEKAVFDRIVPDLFGYHLVQIGGLGELQPAANSRIHHRVRVDLGGNPADASLSAEADALPFASDSVDVVLLPHVLEFEPRPHDALRETFRILAAEGHLLVSVFNPTSLMGLWRVMRRHRRRAPWSGQFLTLPRIKDWLALLGFDVISSHARFFSPPFRNASVLGRLLASEERVNDLLPYLAASHVLLARKRVFTMTPLRPRWATRKRMVAGGLVEPTARESWRD